MEKINARNEEIAKQHQIRIQNQRIEREQREIEKTNAVNAEIAKLNQDEEEATILVLTYNMANKICSSESDSAVTPSVIPYIKLPLCSNIVFAASCIYNFLCKNKDEKYKKYTNVNDYINIDTKSKDRMHVLSKFNCGVLYGRRLLLSPYNIPKYAIMYFLALLLGVTYGGMRGKHKTRRCSSKRNMRNKKNKKTRGHKRK